LAEDVKKYGSETKGLSDHKRTTLKKTFKRIFVEHAYSQEGRGKRRDLHDVHSRRKYSREEEEEMLQIAQTQSITKTQEMLNLSDQGSSYPWP